MANTEKNIAKKKDKKEKKNRLGKFFREVAGEVKKLSWPTKKELVSYSLTVLGFIALMAIIIYALDLAFGEGLGLLTRINAAGSAEEALGCIGLL